MKQLGLVLCAAVAALGITSSLPQARADAVSVTASRSPFLGEPLSVPGRIECEHFDNGGEGVSYHDVSETNEGGEFRDTGVDLLPIILEGPYISHVEPGEWVEYTIDVAADGVYELRFRVACKGPGGLFHAEIDGQDVTGPMRVPDTLGWQNFQTVAREGVALTAGPHVLRLVMDEKGFEKRWVGTFNWIEIALPEEVPTDAPVLEPGEGFASEPDDPGGSGPQAMAHWDTPPHQTFRSDLNVAVVAFHIHGIDRVEFTVDGGPTVAVRQMLPNPQTGVVEYWATLRPEDFERDGPVQVRAVAYPIEGKPRALPPLPLNVERYGDLPQLARYVAPESSGGSDEEGDGSAARPFATIRHAVRDIALASGGLADGGTVYLLPGLHVYGSARTARTQDRYLTITAAPGVAREEVQLAGGGLYTKLVHVSNVTMRGAVTTSWTFEDYLWIDNVHVLGEGRLEHTRWAGGWSGVYLTNSRVTDTASGFPVIELVRNVELDQIACDAFMNVACVINSTVSNHSKSGSDNNYHPDVVQLASKGGTIENMIYYGLVAEENVTAQGLWGQTDTPLKDVAFVNCRLDNRTGRSTGYRVFMFGGPTEHMLIEDCTFVGPARWNSDNGFSAEDVVLRSTVFVDTDPPLKDAEGVVYEDVTYR